jgi:hypothetical protein
MQVRRQAGQPGILRGEMLQFDCLSAVARRAHVRRQVRLKGIAQVHFAGQHHLCEKRGGKGFGNGSDLKDRRVAQGRMPRSETPARVGFERIAIHDAHDYCRPAESGGIGVEDALNLLG